MVVVAAAFYYLFCSSNNFFNLAISASFSSDDNFSSSFCAFKVSISSFILSTINSAVFLSNILNASENILSTSPGLSKYSLISWRTDSRSGNISISLSISCGVSATNNDKNFHHYTDYCHNRNPLSRYALL